MTTTPICPPVHRGDVRSGRSAMAEDAWKHAGAATGWRWRYTVDRPVAQTATSSSRGAPAIVAFLERKWKARAELPADQGAVAFRADADRGAFSVRVAHECEHWFPGVMATSSGSSIASGLMAVAGRRASTMRRSVRSDRKFSWPQGPRPADAPGLTELGL